MGTTEHLESTFNQLVALLKDALQPSEAFTLLLIGESSQFIRFNRARVRQTGCVTDGQLTLTLMSGQRNAYRTVPFTGDRPFDESNIHTALDDLRRELPQIPDDPFLVLPEGDATSREVNPGTLLYPDSAVDAILPEVDGLDFTGIYAGGTLLRAYADSAGQHHWFATDTFSLDYSLFTADGQAVKGTFAGNVWEPATYSAKLLDSKQQLARMAQPPKPIPKGNYRTYLAPAAVSELIDLFSWGAVSEASMQRDGSPLTMLQRGEKQLSDKFSLKENFRRGLVPRFNELGEIAPIELPIIQHGALVNTLISSRTAKEYNKTPNGASGSEGLRSPEVASGSLPRLDILKALDTGLYVSNLHYLNWSDRPTGRITGMTRYACFWVENGELVAPIENLRFDESLYRFFGDCLVDLTDTQELSSAVGTYDHRELGGTWVPGALVDDFTYTL